MKLPFFINKSNYSCNFLLFLILATLSYSSLSYLAESAPIGILSKTGLIVNENYVDPKRIELTHMLVSMLSTAESKISKLVVKLPKSLQEVAQKQNKNTKISENVSSSSSISQEPKEKIEKEFIILEMGNSKISLQYEAPTSIWGLIFFMRDVLNFIQEQIKKQNVTEKSRGSSEPINLEDLEVSITNAMLETLDPHSFFLDSKRARELTVTTKGEFGGIGIVISIKDGFLTVISPVDNTPAAMVGVKAKDKIIQIDDTSAINMDLNDAVNMLRGEPGSKVRITVERENSPKPIELTMKRAIIKVDSVNYSLLSNEIGYLRIKAFQGQTGDDVKAAVLAMKKSSKNKLTGLILDVRDNPGGLLREALSISDLFLDGGEVVSTKGALESSKQVEMASKGQIDPNLKIVILTNAGSASASEIIAGALKYRDRAIIVGERTFGKGSVQMLFDFPDDENKKSKKPYEENLPPATLKLTVAQYFAPEDRVIQTFGIEPDISLNEVYVSKENISIFPNISFREADLDAHLLADKFREEKPLFVLKYLMPDSKNEKENYSNNKPDINALKKDFNVKLSMEILTAAKAPSRNSMLVEAEKVAKKLALEEEKKIIEALKKQKIDWFVGAEKATNKNISYKITENKSVLGGEKLKVSMKVKNISDKPLYQVHGITASKTPLFDHRELLFGKIDPNQEIERSLEFEIPKDVVSRKDYFSVEIKDNSLTKIKDINVPLDIVGLKRPRLAHMIFLEDTNAIDADGKLQVNEEVNLVVWLKNVGEGKAFEPTVLVRNQSGSKLFLKTGREQSKSLLPNEEASMRFSFKVTEPTDVIDFELQIFDTQIRDIWRDKIRLNVSTAKDKANSVNMWLTPSAKSVDLFSKNNTIEEKIATINEGAFLHAIKEENGRYMVKVVDNLIGFVKKTDVKNITAPKSEQKNTAGVYLINYNRFPPKIDLKFADNKGFSRDKKGIIAAEIFGPAKVNEVLMYLNGKKVLYKQIEKYNGQTKISQEIELVPGVNNISLLAREDDYFGQLQNITVFYDDAKESMFIKPKEETKTTNK
jgi:carboxyl-terminal processing protease